MKELKYLFKFYRKYRLRFALGALFVITSNIFAIYPAIYTRKAFDAAKDAIIFSQNSGYDFSNLTSKLLYFGIMIILFSFLKGTFMFLMRQTIIVMSRLIEFDLKNEIFKHYQNLDRSFYKKNNTGDMMARISEDVTKVRMFLGPATMYPINMISLFLLVVYNMFTINIKLSLYVLAPLPIMSITIFLVSKIINTKSEKVQSQLSVLSTISQESFSGIRILKSFVNEKSNLNIFKNQTNEYLNRNVSLAKTNAAFFPFMLLLIGLSTLLTIYIGGKESIAGNISSGNIAEFIIYVNMLTWPMASIGWVTAIIQRAAASQKRINEFLKTETQFNLKDGIFHEFKEKISFKNVDFIYPGSNIKVLENISFEIKFGQTIAIVGKTGTGKSTIINLLCRMYNTTSGSIEIDNINISKINLNKLRAQISLVPQEDLLFSDTISNNIAFGSNKKISQKEIEIAAKKSAIYNSIINFPSSFQTLVGERGVTLSGGQKQRISIARALIRKSKILIFDDCMSAVDNLTQKQILKYLKIESKKKTTIIISHRISSVQHADKIIFIDKGKIAEIGTHENLLKKSGLYYKMYKSQISKIE